MLRLARAALVGVEEEENTFVAEHRRSPHILGKCQMAAPSARANASAFCAHATLHCSSSRSSRPAWAAASKLSARPQTQFADVIGSDEAKAWLNRVKALRHDPTHHARLGASAPRGVLLVGPPGTGKTLLAKALAGESKTNFIAVDGSYFTAMFYGAGVSKVKELFKLARKNAPWVLFIDEVDGLGKRSPGGQGLGGREAKLLVKGSVSSGASDDLKRASDLAINMVGSLGFSKTFGLLSVAGVPKELLGCDIQAALLKEARGTLEKAQAQCEQLLTSRRWQLDALAQALSQREVLCGDELRGCWRSVRDRPPELRIWHDRPSAMRRGTNEDLRNDLYRPPGETCWAI